MSTGRPCPRVGPPRAGSEWRQARTPARRGGRDLFGGHHEGQRDYDVGVPGPHGAFGLGLSHQFAQGVRQAAFNPVPDHNAGAERGGREELLGGCRGGGHPFILGPPAPSPRPV